MVTGGGGTRQEHTWTILGDYTANGRRLDTVNDVVAGARHEMAVAKNVYIALEDHNLSTGPSAGIRLS